MRSAQPVSPRRRALRQSLFAGAGVALLFSLYVAAQMMVIWQVRLEQRPIDHPRLVALREDLAREPGSDALRGEIRLEERRLRTEFLERDRQLKEGAWLLLIGVGSFALCARLALALRPRLPNLVLRGLTYDPDREASHFGRASLVGISAVLAATAIAIPILRGGGAEPRSAQGVWPRFRGAGGLGLSTWEQVPLTFDGREGREVNVSWKMVVPLPGMSSPVLWNERVFLTGATAYTREVYCIDALTGALLWRRPVSAGPESSEIPENIWSETGYAAPTPVTDGKHVWSLFANGDVVCFDVFGKELWCRNLGLPVNMYGLAASPMLHDGRLILQVDQEWGDEGPASALYCLDAATGDEVWRATREVESSWPSPIPIETTRGTQLLTCANPFVIAYDPADGGELWRVDCLSGDGGPSPGFGEGLALAVNVGSPLTAIRPDGEGDVSDTHVAWTYGDGLPDVCSVLADNGLVWLLSTDGLLSCLDGRTGELQYEHDHETSFYSSPTLAAGRIYALGRKGTLYVLDAGRSYAELARGHLGEECDTSPAFSEGRIYVRGERHLYCFEELER